MASYYTITVRNYSSTTQYFYVFQKQASFSAGSGPILSGSLGCQSVGNYQNSGAQISFSLSAQIYVGAVSTAPPTPPPSQSMAFFAARALAIPPTSTKAVWPIQLTSPTSSSMNGTNLTISPLGLSMPASKAGVPGGAFGISVPPYTPTPKPEVYCGVASVNSVGSELLSSFIAPPPNTTVTCAPQPVFFVTTGYMPEGDIVTYDETNAARCDFTAGYTRIIVTYNLDGTFSTADGS